MVITFSYHLIISNYVNYFIIYMELIHSVCITLYISVLEFKSIQSYGFHSRKLYLLASSQYIPAPSAGCLVRFGQNSGWQNSWWQKFQVSNSGCMFACFLWRYHIRGVVRIFLGHPRMRLCVYWGLQGEGYIVHVQIEKCGREDGSLRDPIHVVFISGCVSVYRIKSQRAAFYSCRGYEY